MAAKLVRHMVTLSKPRIVGLLVFVAICGMFKEAQGPPPMPVLIAVLAGGALAAAGSNAINQGMDSDIDAAMRRTQLRPVPAAQITRRMAILMGGITVSISIVIMGALANWLSALLTLGAAVVYVVVYTVIMKRRSWNNIVIGGAAGALPPLIGATAISGQVDTVGVYMFALVFFWTPPHFWALSVALKDDYATARVPMLSVVAGNRTTGIQIVLYITLLIALTWLPVASGYAGMIYAITTTILGLEWLRRSLPLVKESTRIAALKSYKFSLLYLVGAFFTLAFEATLVGN